MMRTSVVAVFFSLAFLHLPARAHAEAVILDPVTIEETNPTEPGELVLRLGGDWSRLEAEGSTVERRVQWAQAYWGIADRWSAEVRVPVEHWSLAGATASGLGDVSVGLKFAVVTGAWPLVVRAESSLPTRSERLGESVTSLEFGLSSLRAAGGAVVQGGIAFAGSTDGEEREWSYGASLARPLTPSLHVLLEGAGEYEVNESLHRLNIGPALRGNLGGGWSLGAAGLVGATAESPDVRVILHLQCTR